MKLKLNDILLILVVACVGFMLVQHFIHLSDFKSLIKEKEEEIIRKTQEQNQIIEHYESKIQQIISVPGQSLSNLNYIEVSYKRSKHSTGYRVSTKK